jgi:hypothetical protein
MPEYRRFVAELRAIDKLGHSVEALLKIQLAYQTGAMKKATIEPNGEVDILLACESCGSSVRCTCSVGSPMTQE